MSVNKLTPPYFPDLGDFPKEFYWKIDDLLLFTRQHNSSIWAGSPWLRPFQMPPGWRAAPLPPRSPPENREGAWLVSSIATLAFWFSGGVRGGQAHSSFKKYLYDFRRSRKISLFENHWISLVLAMVFVPKNWKCRIIYVPICTDRDINNSELFQAQICYTGGRKWPPVATIFFNCQALAAFGTSIFLGLDYDSWWVWEGFRGPCAQIFSTV